MDYNKEGILYLLDSMLLSQRNMFLVDLGQLLLNHIFVSWNAPGCLISEKHIRKFLVTDFYQILCENQSVYIEDLKDYSKNAEEHLLIQTKIKKIAEICLSLRKKDFHDEIIYYMNILS
jgi:hypothetical protein